MATNLKSDGKQFDANYIIATGATITAGSFIFVDVSGTNVVRAVRSYSGTSVESAATPTGRGIASLDTALGPSGLYLGVIANTQTGTGNLSGGSQTGVTWYTEGVFEFNTTPTASANYRVGLPVYATNNDTVVVATSGFVPDASGFNTTGFAPVGIISYLPRGPVTTNTVASRVRVKIFPFRTLPVG